MVKISKKFSKNKYHDFLFDKNGKIYCPKCEKRNLKMLSYNRDKPCYIKFKYKCLNCDIKLSVEKHVKDI